MPFLIQDSFPHTHCVFLPGSTENIGIPLYVSGENKLLIRSLFSYASARNRPRESAEPSINLGRPKLSFLAGSVTLRLRKTLRRTSTFGGTNFRISRLKTADNPLAGITSYRPGKEVGS